MNIAAAASGKPIDPATAGYVVFTGKAQCAVCHTPPLYTDFRYHRVDTRLGDEGRGKVDPRARFAFRDAVAARRGRADAHSSTTAREPTLEAALDAHVPPTALGARTGRRDRSGARGAGARSLTADERAHLLAFVRALSNTKSPTTKPALP